MFKKPRRLKICALFIMGRRGGGEVQQQQQQKTSTNRAEGVQQQQKTSNIAKGGGAPPSSPSFSIPSFTVSSYVFFKGKFSRNQTKPQRETEGGLSFFSSPILRLYSRDCCQHLRRARAALCLARRSIARSGLLSPPRHHPLEPALVIVLAKQQSRMLSHKLQ